MVKTRVIRLRGVEGRDARHQIAFLVEVQTNAAHHSRPQNPSFPLVGYKLSRVALGTRMAAYIHATHAK